MRHVGSSGSCRNLLGRTGGDDRSWLDIWALSGDRLRSGRSRCGMTAGEAAASPQRLSVAGPFELVMGRVRQCIRVRSTSSESSMSGTGIWTSSLERSLSRGRWGRTGCGSPLAVCGSRCSIGRGSSCAGFAGRPRGHAPRSGFGVQPCRCTAGMSWFARSKHAEGYRSRLVARRSDLAERLTGWTCVADPAQVRARFAWFANHYSLVDACQAARSPDSTGPRNLTRAGVLAHM